MVRIGLAVAVLAVATGAQASAKVAQPGCMMTVLAPTPAKENPSAIMAKGTRWGPATQMRIGLADGRVSYCAHGDYCFPAKHLRFVTPCTPDATPLPATTGDIERIYGLRGQPAR